MPGTLLYERALAPKHFAAERKVLLLQLHVQKDLNRNVSE